LIREGVVQRSGIEVSNGEVVSSTNICILRCEVETNRSGSGVIEKLGAIEGEVTDTTLEIENGLVVWENILSVDEVSRSVYGRDCNVDGEGIVNVEVQVVNILVVVTSV